ncbi:hypothetical protein [Jeotgalibacillus proteolyticus]|uniref:Uncharacterized protein n=1 Tax=Jeotgalibacillus proteolyticus TaxID=2082395 RepID=A0A2S5GBH9_9BACL|nr:hypothetical protein [Jeotgalibacillus proteolyticus]PPA70382.1 hypothetical protein C4B60_12455 [Jeotgalibacillus proteolyticus]
MKKAATFALISALVLGACSPDDGYDNEEEVEEDEGGHAPIDEEDEPAPDDDVSAEEVMEGAIVFYND